MDRSYDRDVLFQILLDDDATGFTLIQGAPIHSCEDLRRARAEIARIGHRLPAVKHPN
ncbi:MAG TPA: hypothetical protein VMQ11_11865 [Alphaproteobacteria bacterium]|nr:hypothetical protein [Alphaproteobacteria bacterium]